MSLAMATLVSAASFHPLASESPSSATTAPSPDHTIDSLIPQRLVWPGIAVIVVVAIFITAALAAPLIRANLDDVDSSDAPKHDPESSEESE